MEKIKNSIVSKTISFILIQVCVVTIVFSGIIVFYNVNYQWYSSDYKDARMNIMQEIATDVELQIHDGMYFNLDSGSEVYWPEYMLKEYDMPEGIGYEFQLLKKVNKNTDAIKLKKNTDLADKTGVYSQELSNDLYKLTVYVADPLEMQEDVYDLYPENLAQRYEFYNLIYQYNKIAIIICALALVVLLLLIVYWITSIKADPDANGILKKIPVDLAFGVCLAVGIALCFVLDDLMNTSNYELAVFGIMLICIALSSTVTAFVFFFIYRIKCGKWWNNSLICFALKIIMKVIRFGWKYIKIAASWVCEKLKAAGVLFARVIKKVPLIWKTVAVLSVLFISNLIIAVYFSWSQAAVFLWVLETIIVAASVIYVALCLKRLQQGAGKLAEGNLAYKTETKGLFWDFAEHAENLNRISDGMAAAVEERIKSERFKAELITNVSHDIKTPLTSIINYVDLLNKENIEDEKICEYIEVLDRQSKRLKKLTEDLVDASKVSTGNIKIDLAPCNVGMLISQTMGEYESKAAANELEPILKIPENELEILADGRRLWRVFDNLLNNICKYAQPGTRVYISLEEVDGKAVIVYRNVSKYELDISAEELMERFVRGDRSRHTEGSGLGLSIARNLVELQGGTFEISIDGDLFKVKMEFDLLNL